MRVTVANEDGVGLAAPLYRGLAVEDLGYCRRFGHIVVGDRPSGNLSNRGESCNSSEAELEPWICQYAIDGRWRFLTYDMVYAKLCEIWRLLWAIAWKCAGNRIFIPSDQRRS